PRGRRGRGGGRRGADGAPSPVGSSSACPCPRGGSPPARREVSPIDVKSIRGGTGRRKHPSSPLTRLGINDLDELLVFPDGVEIRVAAGLGPVGRTGRDRGAQ